MSVVRRCLRASPPLTAAALLALLAAVEAWAQARERTFYVSALTKATGAPVDSLTVRDVVVREDGVEREVLRVAPAAEPMQVALLVDNSEALRSDILNV